MQLINSLVAGVFPCKEYFIIFLFLQRFRQSLCRHDQMALCISFFNSDTVTPYSLAIFLWIFFMYEIPPLIKASLIDLSYYKRHNI